MSHKTTLFFERRGETSIEENPWRPLFRIDGAMFRDGYKDGVLVSTAAVPIEADSDEEMHQRIEDMIRLVTSSGHATLVESSLYDFWRPFVKKIAQKVSEETGASEEDAETAGWAALTAPPTDEDGNPIEDVEEENESE